MDDVHTQSGIITGTEMLLPIKRMASSLYPRECQTGKLYIYTISLSPAISLSILRHSLSNAASAITCDFSHCVNMFRIYGSSSWPRF